MKPFKYRLPRKVKKRMGRDKYLQFSKGLKTTKVIVDECHRLMNDIVKNQSRLKVPDFATGGYLSKTVIVEAIIPERDTCRYIQQSVNFDLELTPTNKEDAPKGDAGVLRFR